MSEGPQEERRWERPPRRRGRSVLVAIVVLALVAAVLWLLAERNARQWFLVFQDGALQVKRGLLLPAGSQAFRTDDPALAAAYAPIKPPPGAKLDEERRFDDRAGLDQALYELLARWARDDVATDKPELVERALQWIGRAEKLAGISTAQREDLRVLRAEVGWFEGRQLLDKSADAIRQARERFRLAAGSPTAHAREADSALRRLDPLLDELHRVIREAAPSSASAPAAPPAGNVGNVGAPPNAAPSAPANVTPPAPSPAAPK